MCARPATQWLLEQRDAESNVSKREYFEEMEPGFAEIMQGTKFYLASLFGHEV